MMSMKSPKITPDIVQKVARLAHLTITPQEQQKFATQLSSVLAYISKIQKLKTENVEETSQVTGLTNVTRQDEVDEKRMFTQEESLSNAKQVHEGYFMVPAIFEE